MKQIYDFFRCKILGKKVPGCKIQFDIQVSPAWGFQILFHCWGIWTSAFLFFKTSCSNKTRKTSDWWTGCLLVAPTGTFDKKGSPSSCFFGFTRKFVFFFVFVFVFVITAVDVVEPWGSIRHSRVLSLNLPLAGIVALPQSRHTINYLLKPTKDKKSL